MMTLCLKDQPVLTVDITNGIYEIHNEDLLPYSLRGAITDSRNGLSVPQLFSNYDLLMNFFRNRNLSILRENAKKILNCLGLPQATDNETVLKTVFLCKGLSVTDDYWLNNGQQHWDEVNLRKNPLHEVLAQVALTGEVPLSITGKLLTPELTNQGAYAKAWYRDNGKLYLYKANTSHGRESEIEVAVSNILDHTNVPHVKYTLEKKDGKTCCKCESLCNDKKGIASAYDLTAWANRNETTVDKLALKYSEEDYYKMLVVDYLISNSDRHIQNWGFYFNQENGELQGLHPLFDHNCAFDKEEMKSHDGGMSLVANGKSKREAALFAMKRCDFKIDKDLSKKDFLTEEHYNSFKRNAKELGIQIQEKTKKSFLSQLFK